MLLHLGVSSFILNTIVCSLIILGITIGQYVYRKLVNLVTENLCIFGPEEKQGKGINNYSNRALISYYIICI